MRYSGVLLDKPNSHQPEVLLNSHQSLNFFRDVTSLKNLPHCHHVNQSVPNATPPEQHKACWDMINDNYLVIDHALAIPSPATFGEVVDCGELNQGGEDKGVTHGNEPVHGCGVGDFR